MKRISYLILGLLILVYMSVLSVPPVYSAASVKEPEFQIDTDSENTSAKKTAKDMADEFLAKKGWQEGENIKSNGKKFYIGIGEGSIQAPINHPRYLQARINAFEKAFAKSKQELAEFIGTEISNTLIRKYSEPNANEESEDTESSSGSESAIIDKLSMFAHAKLDKMLKAEGVNPKEADTDQIAEVLPAIATSEEFKKMTNTMAKTYLSGLQVFKCFEGPGEGQGYAIVVVTIYSDKLREMASSIYTGKKPKIKAPKKPIQKQIPIDNNILMQTFGIQQKIDENGNLVLVAFAQGAPRTSSSNSISMAYRKAKIAGMGYIRSFAGENYMTTSDAINAETTTEFDDNTKNYREQSKFDDIIKSYSQKLNISGIKTLKKWKHIHPLTGKKVAGVVLAWSPQSAARAKALGKTLNSNAHQGVGTTASSRNSTYSRKKLDHAGLTGSGAEADEDAF